MGTNATVWTATSASSVALAFMVIVNWFMSSHGITLPGDVQQAIGTLIAFVIHPLFSSGKSAKKPTVIDQPEK